MNVIEMSYKIYALRKNIPIETVDEELKLKEKYDINEKMKMTLHCKKGIASLFLSNENNVKIVLYQTEKRKLHYKHSFQPSIIQS
jgi:hypothetical protein